MVHPEIHTHTRAHTSTHTSLLILNLTDLFVITYLNWHLQIFSLKITNIYTIPNIKNYKKVYPTFVNALVQNYMGRLVLRQGSKLMYVCPYKSLWSMRVRDHYIIIAKAENCWYSCFVWIFLFFTFFSLLNFLLRVAGDSRCSIDWTGIQTRLPSVVYKSIYEIIL